MKAWLLRRNDLSFSRPLPEPEMIKLIESGQVKAEDEISAANSYWFSIQEVEEVKKHFGNIHLKALVPTESEITSSTNIISLENTLVPVKIAKAKLKTLVTKAPPLVLAPIVSSIPPPSLVPPVPVTPLEPRRPEMKKVPSKSAGAMGWLLFLIFCGTLGLLWWGSK